MDFTNLPNHIVNLLKKINKTPFYVRGFVYGAGIYTLALVFLYGLNSKLFTRSKLASGGTLVLILFFIISVAGTIFFFSYKEKKEKTEKEEKHKKENEECSKSIRTRALLPFANFGEWRVVSAEIEQFMLHIANILNNNVNSHITLEISTTPKGIILQVVSPENLFPTVITGLLAIKNIQLKDPQQVIGKKDIFDLFGDQPVYYRRLKLQNAPYFPLKRINDTVMGSDPVSYIISSLYRTSNTDRLGVQIVLRAPEKDIASEGAQYLQQQEQMLEGKTQGSKSKQAKNIEQIRAVSEKIESIKMSMTLRVFSDQKSANRLDNVANNIITASKSGFNNLVVLEQVEDKEGVVRKRHFDFDDIDNIVTPEELGVLWHPTRTARDVVTAQGADLPPSAENTAIGDTIPFSSKYRILGKGYMRDGEEVYVVWPQGKKWFGWLVHSFISGATGSGKSTLLSNLIMQDICAGYGAIVLEPHRNLILDLITRIPPERETDTLWASPTTIERTFCINPLDFGGDPQFKAPTASSFTMTIQKMLSESAVGNAYRVESIITNAALAVMDAVPGAHILHLAAFLRNQSYRESLLDKIENYEVKEFWGSQFSNSKDQKSVLDSVNTRLRKPLSMETTRYVMAYSDTTVPFRDVMDSGIILLIDVSASDQRVGSENANILGTLIVNNVWGQAQSRVKGTYCIPTFFWIDEAHRFVTKTINNILAEARGYGLGLNLATQYYDQLPDWLKDAVMNNTYTKLVGQVNSHGEAAQVSKILNCTPEELKTLPEYHYIGVVSIGSSVKSNPTVISTLPPLDTDFMVRKYTHENNGKMPTPLSNGGKKFDAFVGVKFPDREEMKVYARHRRKMNGYSLRERAHYLSELSDDDFKEYVYARRCIDKLMFERIVSDKNYEPDYVINLSHDELKNLGEKTVKRIKRIGTLTELQVCIPREELMALDIKLSQEVGGSKSGDSIDVGFDFF